MSSPGPTFKTLDDYQIQKVLSMVRRLENGTLKPENILDAYEVKRRQCFVLIDSINDAPRVIDIKSGASWIFDSETGSGTDFLRKRIDAQQWFDRLADDFDRSGIAYHLSVETLPRNLSWDDLPVIVGRYEVRRTVNSVSGQEWAQPQGLRRGAKISGPGVTSEEIRNLKDLRKQIEFLENHPFLRQRTEREDVYLEASDAELTRAIQSRQRM